MNPDKIKSVIQALNSNTISFSNSANVKLVNDGYNIRFLCEDNFTYETEILYVSEHTKINYSDSIPYHLVISYNSSIEDVHSKMMYLNTLKTELMEDKCAYRIGNKMCLKWELEHEIKITISAITRLINHCKICLTESLRMKDEQEV